MNYYYLISGLPDLSLDAHDQKIEFIDVLDTIQRNLEPEDEKLFRYLLYPNDNRNLLNILLKEYKGFPEAAFLSPSLIAENDLKNYRKQQTALPTYLSEFLKEYEGQLQTMARWEIEDKLWEKFYEEVEHQSPFIIDYFRFERELKAILSSYNSSYFSFLEQPPSQNGDHIFGQVGKGKSPTPGLLREYPYLETLGEIITTHEPDKIEKFIDRIKWDYLMEIKGFFTKEQVFAYVLRLLVVLRWQRLRPDEGSTSFSKLQERIKSNIHLPLTAIV